MEHTMSVITIFESIKHGLLKKILLETNINVETGKPEPEVTYVLSSSLSDEHYLQGVAMPLLTLPRPVTLKNINFMIKPFLFGDFKLLQSQGICEVLTIVQKKCFNVNIRFVNILKSVFKLDVAEGIDVKSCSQIRQVMSSLQVEARYFNKDYPSHE